MYGRNMFSKIVLLETPGVESELRVGVRSKEYIQQHLYRVWSDIQIAGLKCQILFLAFKMMF
jgi:hypothetical protein